MNMLLDFMSHLPACCLNGCWYLLFFFFKWLMVNEKFYIMCYTDLTSTGMFNLKQFFVWWTSSKVHEPFNAGIKSQHNTAWQNFLLGILLLELCILLIYACVATRGRTRAC
jgi:hypothetical protein